MNRLVLLFCLPMVLLINGCRYSPGSEELALMNDSHARQAINDVLGKQEKDWNEGAVDRFMESYWRSDSLRFVSDGTVSYGWQNTLDNYRRRYPSRASMGILTFSEIAVRPLTSDWATAFGRFTLERTEEGGGAATGLFTLVLQRKGDTWLIVQDHTSVANPAS